MGGCRAESPGSSVGLLVGRVGSCQGWLWGLGYPKAGVGPPVSEAVSWGSQLKGLRCLRAGVGLLVSGARAQGVLGLVPAHWWVRQFPDMAAMGSGVS